MSEAPPPDSANIVRLAARAAQRIRIIGEIRRIAAENGGVPPGKLQFERKTGIRPSAWAGRLWARWPDALREAGYAPNPSNPRLKDDDMLAGIADAALLLGHIPSATEMGIYRESGRWLPGHQAYMHHFGSKEGMLRCLKRWAAASPERADIAAMLTGIRDAPLVAPPVTGAVYLLRFGRSSYKIGCSRMVEQRVRDLQLALPAKARLIHAIDTDDPHGIEAYWHRRFAEKRYHGEWFKLSPEDVAAFRHRRFQ